MNTVTPARTSSPFQLALYWLGIQAVWGAVLGISLQARTIELLATGQQIASNRLAATGAAVAAAVQILAGFWSDARRRGGSRRIEFYLLGGVAGAAALALFYGARSFAELTLAYVALQAALNLAIGPYQAIIPDFVERMRFGTASSWMAALQSAGNAAGALAASFIANARALGASLGVLLLCTCAVTTAHARGLELREPSATCNPLRITRAFVDLFVSRAIVYVGFYTLLFNLLYYVRSMLGASDAAEVRLHTGILIVSFTLVGALGAGIAARPSDRIDKRLVATLGAVLFLIALGVFIGSHQFAGAIVATLVAGIGWGVFLVADWAIACRVLPAGAMATAMGVWNLAVVLPQVAAPALTAAVLLHAARGGGIAAPTTAFILAFGETLIGAAWLWRIPRSVIEGPA